MASLGAQGSWEPSLPHLSSSELQPTLFASLPSLFQCGGVSEDGARARRKRGGFQCFPPARGVRRSHGLFWESASFWNIAGRCASLEIGGPGGYLLPGLSDPVT